MSQKKETISQSPKRHSNCFLRATNIQKTQRLFIKDKENLTFKKLEPKLIFLISYQNSGQLIFFWSTSKTTNNNSEASLYAD